MNADDARAELEARLWNLSLARPETSLELVDRALEAADKYAQTFGAEFAGAVLDGAIRDNRTRERRQVLVNALRGKG